MKDKFGYPGVHKRSVKSVLENVGLYQVPRKSAIRRNEQNLYHYMQNLPASTKHKPVQSFYCMTSFFSMICNRVFKNAMLG